jgi:hypothetical protein
MKHSQAFSSKFWHLFASGLAYVCTELAAPVAAWAGRGLGHWAEHFLISADGLYTGALVLVWPCTALNEKDILIHVSCQNTRIH